MNPPKPLLEVVPAYRTVIPPAPRLDDLLTMEQMAAWWQLDVHAIAPKCKGPRARIPAFWLNQRVVRFHPRTIIAKLASERGLSDGLIAAMLSGMDARLLAGLLNLTLTPTLNDAGQK